MNFKGHAICNTRYIIDSQFSRGTVGTVYNIKDNNKLLVKVISIKNNNSRRTVLREIRYMTKAAAKSISPKIYNVKFCKLKNIDYVFIIMEKYGEGTLEDLFQAFNNMNFSRRANNDILQKIGSKIKILFDKLYSLEILHGDLHARNIVFKLTRSGNVYLKIIDFGYSKNIINNENLNRENKNISSLNGEKGITINNNMKTKYYRLN